MNQPTTSGSSVYFRKKIGKGLQTVSLDADMIRLLLVIDESKSIYQIAAEMDMDAPTFQKTLRRLLQQGLIESVQKSAPLVNRDFLQALRMNLARVIGPMAGMVLNEVLADFQLSPAAISVDQAAELINHIALEIPEEASRIQFKKAMVPILNKVKS